MKKITYTIGLIFLTVMTSFSQDENLSLTFNNATLTNDGSSDFYEVDIVATLISPVDFRLGDGQFYINYNPDAFGTEIDNTTVDFEYTSSSILGEMNVFNIYTDPIIANRSNGIISIAFEQSLSSGSMAADNIIAAGKVLGHLKIEMIDTNQDPQITFNITGTDFTNAFFTACGDTDPGPAFKNCGTVGVDYFQIIGYDGTDNSGAALPIEACSGGSTIFTTAQTWDPVAPDDTMTAIIEGEYDTDTFGNIEACELNIAEGGSLIINPLTYVRVQNNITNDGTFTVLNTGNLVQVNDDATVANNGTIDVEVITPDLDPRDFMVIGSPMTAEVRENLAGFRMLQHSTSDFDPNLVLQNIFDDGTNFVDDDLAGQAGFDWTANSGVLTPGEGYYYIPGPNLQTGGEYTLNFNTGTLNNGIVEYTTGVGDNQNDSPNIISNPYPSGISTSAFIAKNNAVNEVYFWEHLTNPGASFPGANNSYYNMSDISVYNGMGGSDGMAPDVIATSQGFGFKAVTADNIEFNNSMRMVSGNITLRAPENALNRLWLQVRNEEYDIQSSMLVGFSTLSTAGYDAQFDSKRLIGNLSLYSLIQGEEQGYIIQGREAFTSEMTIPVGFQSLVEESVNYTISLSDIDGEVWNTNNIYLVDNFNGTITDLTESDYEFSTQSGNFAERFLIKFENQLLGNSTSDVALIFLYPNPTKNVLNIVSPNTLINNINITDIQGRRVFAIDNINASEKAIDIAAFNSAVYFVTINTSEGSVIKRVIKE